jgi:hypothetical protein
MAPVSVISGVKTSTNCQHKIGIPRWDPGLGRLFLCRNIGAGAGGEEDFLVPWPGALFGAKSDAQVTVLSRPFQPSADDARDSKTMGMAPCAGVSPVLSQVPMWITSWHSQECLGESEISRSLFIVAFFLGERVFRVFFSAFSSCLA